MKCTNNTCHGGMDYMFGEFKDGAWSSLSKCGVCGGTGEIKESKPIKEVCECCNNSKILLTKEVANTGILYWGIGKPITKEALEACDMEVGVLVDRGYLRLCTEDDSCLDHGEKIAINFCPMCGDSLT